MTKNQFNQRNILATLLWFSLRGRSLSLPEITRLQYKSTFSRTEIKALLTKIKALQVDSGNRYAVELNRDRHLSVTGYQHKWRVANLGKRLLGCVPFIESVAVVNSLADHTARPDSDIDFFIITQPNRLFIARILSTLILSLTNLRRRRHKIKNHICLSFFVTTQALDFSKIKITGEDIYLAYWIAQARPIINYQHNFQNFLNENSWVKKIVPNYNQRTFVSNKKNGWVRFLELSLAGSVGDWFEKILRNWQLERIGRQPKSTNPDVKIIANQDMLKFHEIDRRRLYRKQWSEALERLS